MNKELQARKLRILTETAEYYCSDVSLRALDECGYCRYETYDGKRCAIGRLLSNEKVKEFIDNDVLSIHDSVMKLLPDELQILGEEFLSALQFLHDLEENWNEEGMTKEGKEQVKRMKEAIEEGKM